MHTPPFNNILPFDGETYYLGKIIDGNTAARYFSSLLHTIHWQQDVVVMFGKTITTKREVAWYGCERLTYRYSGKTKTALLWTTELLELKSIVEKISGEDYNSCLLNLYHTGGEGMGWHSDDEKDLKKNGSIASLSLGAERKFSFKHKQLNEKVTLLLQNGSLLIMKGATQQHWLHQLPPSKKIMEPRINLTFRQIIQ